MMSLPEMGTAVMNEIPVVFLVQNNRGYMSIRGGQRKFMGRHIASAIARQHMDEALRVLNGEAPGLIGDEALAERERYRCEEELRDSAQAVLPLEPRP